MLSESSIVASAMVFMAEDIQKQLSGRGLSLPLEVINNVVANEVWVRGCAMRCGSGAVQWGVGQGLCNEVWVRGCAMRCGSGAVQ